MSKVSLDANTAADTDPSVPKNYPEGNGIAAQPAQSAHFNQTVTSLLRRQGLADEAIASIRGSAGLDVFIRIDTVTALIGLSVPTVYRLMAKGDFPRPVRLTTSARGWKLSDIVGWMQSRSIETGQPMEALAP